MPNARSNVDTAKHPLVQRLVRNCRPVAFAAIVGKYNLSDW